MATSSILTQTAADRILRLLVPAGDTIPVDMPAITLLDRRWVVSDALALSPSSGIKGYTCVSYAWGQGRVEHPFDVHQTISDRTIAAAEAAIGIERPNALWVDAFCVPFEEPARTDCLTRMGAIYEAASTVIVVLSERCSSLVEQVANSGPVDVASMLAFERDEWLTRVWTYQELVNCNSIRFVAEKGVDVSVGAEDVLNHVSHAMSEYRKEEGYDSFEMKSLLPHLDSLEDLILDWKISMPEERSAYRVMCGMEGRSAAQPEDFFYAMVGAITPSSRDVPSDPDVHPAEFFMRVCEARGDYSFVFATAPRAETPGRRWRPATVDRFEPVFPWTSFGEGQSGTIYPTHIQLDGISRATRRNVAPAAEQYLAKWLNDGGTHSLAEVMPTRILKRLRDAGFSGCGEHLELENGYFFPHSPAPRSGEILIAVSTGVRMPQGAPGLLLKPGHSGIYEYCGVGMFVGPVPKVGERINVG